MTKPNFMANPVKTADSVKSKLAGDASNNKRHAKNLKKNLEQKPTITPKKRPARGRLLCLFPHRTAMVGTMLFFHQFIKNKRVLKMICIIFFTEMYDIAIKLPLTGVFKRDSISDTVVNDRDYLQRPKQPRSIKSYRVELTHELSVAEHLHIYYLFH